MRPGFSGIEPPHCSFCGKSSDVVKRLIAGPEGVYICNECVRLCKNILDEELGPSMPTTKGDFHLEKIAAPREMHTYLNEYVIGQDAAKRALAVAVYNHYKRINARQEGSGLELDKSNILLIGPTGCGKTLLAQTLARILNVPFCIVDATALTEAGYVGEDVENILLRLIQAADYDLARAEKGIIYIDEIDKIARKSGDNPSITRDVSGEGVQQALLKIVEGTVANVPPQGGRKHPHQEFIQLNTSDILFICGGAFADLDRIVADRMGKRGVGFGKTGEKASYDQAEVLKLVTAEDLMRYGLIPEFVGRLPVIATIDMLDEAALIQVLTEPKNALVKQYQHLLGLDGVDLEFTPEALVAVARASQKYKTGARSLRGIIERSLMDVMFEVPSRKQVAKVVVTEEAINGTARPTILDKKGKVIPWREDGSLGSAA